MTATAAKEPTAVATVKKHPIATLIESPEARVFIEPFLPKGVSVERVAAQAILYIRDNPLVGECEPDTIVRGVAKALAWNLDLGTTAYLVPFRTKVKLPGGKEEYRNVATFIAGYKGLAELMVGSGAVRHVEAHVVYEKDEFTYEYGSDAQLRHVPWGDPRTRGPIKGAWCGLHLPFGRKAFLFVPIPEIEDTRQRYSKQWKDGPCPPWSAMKTAVRRAAALVPKNPRLAERLLALDNDERDIPLPIATVHEAPLLMAGDVADHPTQEQGETKEPTDAELAAEDARLAEQELPLGDKPRRTRNAITEGR